MTQLINKANTDAGNRKSKEGQELAKGRSAGTSLGPCACAKRVLISYEGTNGVWSGAARGFTPLER